MTAPKQVTVGIIGGDPIVGQALELLLQAAGYGARFLPEPVADKVGELLADIGLLLLAPALSAEHRDALMAGRTGTPTAAKIPILSLLSASEEAQSGEERGVLWWPCRAEELERAIEAALLPRPAPSEGDLNR